MSKHVAPLVFIVGPTASGKTDLAIRLAEKYNGEIICADSRTVYKEMDIGTAKPTAAEQARVPHWGLDLVKPNEPFNVSDFKSYALAKIEDIRARGKQPFIVGGSGLYVDAVLFDYQFGDPADPELRKKLETMSLDELHTYCTNYNVPLPENSGNKRYVIRAIEQQGINTQRRATPVDGTIVVGIATDNVVLRDRIAKRAEHLFAGGVVDEAKRLGKKYGWDSEAMTGNIYQLARQYNAGDITLEMMKEKFITSDWRLAKRQLTWFRRNSFIHWLPLDKAEQFIAWALAADH